VTQQQGLLERALLRDAGIVEREAAGREARIFGIDAVLDLGRSQDDALVAPAPEIERLAQSRTPELGRLHCVEPRQIQNPAEIVRIDDQIERHDSAKNGDDRCKPNPNVGGC